MTAKELEGLFLELFAKQYNGDFAKSYCNKMQQLLILSENIKKMRRFFNEWKESDVIWSSVTTKLENNENTLPRYRRGYLKKTRT